MPKRIQRQRTKGWKMPEGAVYVGRPTKWGNPYKVLRVDKPGFYPYGWRVRPEPAVALVRHIWPTETAAVERAVALYRKNLIERIAHGSVDVTELAGRDLACWCPLDQPCHTDALLELVNQ
ncbi:DUF4326 domain-containing protein [Nocardia sp. NPDC060249]|uniref:DUF4326 domain-containing protein n=1 Tax=Nocardia sp. NPDC060249 TaxID=3347082 RepID=UPI00365AD926